MKAAKDRKLVGVNTQAFDVPTKSQDTAIYGIDATYEGMVYAKPLLPPTRYGSSVQSVGDSPTKSVQGNQQSLVLDDPSNSVPGWVLVVADSYHAAQRAAKVIDVNWLAGPTAAVQEADLIARADEQIASGEGALVFDDAGVDTAFDTAEKVLEAR